MRPARAAARIPVLAALSGRRPQPQAVRRPAKLGAGLLVAGVFFLAISGGLGSQSGGNLLVGIAAIAAGISLLAPLCLVVLTGLAGPLAPVAIRIALRDLVRYRARSGAALAATCFAVFLAMLICMVASIRFSDILDWTGPNLTTSQLIVYTSYYPTSTGPGTAPTQAQLEALHAKVDSFAGSLDARAVLALDEAGTSVPGQPRRPPPGRDPPGRPSRKQIHRTALRGHPGAARRVRDQAQPDPRGHGRPDHASRPGVAARH